MIASLLIANRGEIACRIIRTARAMGIRTVAVYSDADARARHVRQADEAVHIGASPPRESYLAGDKIIAAAKATNAEAIHPGYGFLSENADFAQAVIDAGLSWVGPNPSSIRAMGLKDAAKTLMAAAGVPVTPGYMGDNQDPAFLAAEAEAIGYPVLIKAVAGGGGKGMRKVEAAGDFADALTSCQREATSSFANAHVLIEKYIQRPRHIEVQVFGDTHGNIVHLFERDCSLQRRHQKVIEEAPAPGMDEATREAICAVAVKAARAVDYVGAGTIEFIADASQGLRADRIWFMEMNTRLQVEHPVTEEITGVDLVEWQLRVASGEPLLKRQDELSINGWAIEARLYAEDPANGFLPSVGRLEHFALADTIRSHRWEQAHTSRKFDYPAAATARIETGVTEGDEVSSFYDPMVAKLICHAPDRREAARGLSKMCWDARVWPVRTNASFLGTALVYPDFIKEDIDTGFVARFEAELVYDVELPKWLLDTVADRIVASHLSKGVFAPGFRLNRPSVRDVAFSDRGGRFIGNIGGRSSYDQLHYPLVDDDGEAIVVTMQGATWRFTSERLDGLHGAVAGSGTILSPMPGRIIAVEVADGAAVVKGQKLVTLEAMKMEHSLVAPFDGTIAELNAVAGAQVSEGAVLVRVQKGEA